MKKRFLRGFVIVALAIPMHSFALAPIQRVDVVNLLWNGLGGGGLTQTTVELSFYNGRAEPCYTTTLAFRGSIKVFAGVGEACVAPIDEIAITPLPTMAGDVYLPPSNVIFNTQNYLNQLEIIQLTTPTFDPDNATLLTAGTATTVVSTY